MSHQGRSLRDATIGGSGPSTTGSSYPPSDADHVYASDHLDIRRHGGADAGVNVRGWPELEGDAQTEWIDTISDHAMLFGEVHT